MPCRSICAWTEIQQPPAVDLSCPPFVPLHPNSDLLSNLPSRLSPWRRFAVSCTRPCLKFKFRSVATTVLTLPAMLPTSTVDMESCRRT
jgi:hypothetical protein